MPKMQIWHIQLLLCCVFMLLSYLRPDDKVITDFRIKDKGLLLLAMPMAPDYLN